LPCCRRETDKARQEQDVDLLFDEIVDMTEGDLRGEAGLRGGALQTLFTRERLVRSDSATWKPSSEKKVRQKGNSSFR